MAGPAPGHWWPSLGPDPAEGHIFVFKDFEDEDAPAFYTASLCLGLDKEVRDARELPIDERMDAADRMFKEGNRHYAKVETETITSAAAVAEAVEQAYHHYTRALACIRYLEPTEEGWQEQATSDVKVRQVFKQRELSSPQRALVANNLLCSCYMNVAVCRQRFQMRESDIAEVIAACDEITALDPQHAKAFYTRGCMHDKRGNHELAIKDLEQAARFDPTEPIIKDELDRVRAGRGFWPRGSSAPTVCACALSNRLCPARAAPRPGRAFSTGA